MNPPAHHVAVPATGRTVPGPDRELARFRSRNSTAMIQTGEVVAHCGNFRRGGRNMKLQLVAPRSLRRRQVDRLAVGALAVGATAVGALALGALAVGSIAIGRLAIARLVARSFTIKTLRIESLEVG